MARSISIKLPRSYSPLFPDCCVVCNADSPQSRVRIITGTVGWWTWVLWWWWRPFVVKAPACARCAWKLHGLRLLNLVASIAIIAASLWVIWPICKESLPSPLRKWAAMGFAIICFLPKAIFDFFFARPFDVTAYYDTVDYDFTSHDYAVEFVALNDDAPWIDVSGVDLDADG